MLLSVNGGDAPIDATNFSGLTGTSGLPNFFDYSGAQNFSLGDTEYFLNFTGMFDAYKITKVKCTIDYLNNASSVNSTGLMPTIYMYWDQDDNFVPATQTSIMGKQGVKKTQLGYKNKTAASISLKPVVKTDSQGSSSVLATKSMWLDCTDETINHYGLKWYIADIYLPGSAAVTHAFRFNWTYYIEFRSPLLTT